MLLALNTSKKAYGKIKIISQNICHYSMKHVSVSINIHTDVTFVFLLLHVVGGIISEV